MVARRLISQLASLRDCGGSIEAAELARRDCAYRLNPSYVKRKTMLFSLLANKAWQYWLSKGKRWPLYYVVSGSVDYSLHNKETPTYPPAPSLLRLGVRSGTAERDCHLVSSSSSPPPSRKPGGRIAVVVDGYLNFRIWKKDDHRGMLLASKGF